MAAHRRRRAPARKRQAVRAVEDVGYDRIISATTLRRAAIGAAAGTLVLVAGSAAFAPTMTRGLGVAAAYLLPSRLLIEVTPGTTKLRAGSPLTITARLRGLEAGPRARADIGNDKAAKNRQDDRGRRRHVLGHLREGSGVVSVCGRGGPVAFGHLRHRGDSARSRSSASTCATAIRRVSACRRASRKTAATSTARPARACDLTDRHRQAHYRGRADARRR